MLKRKTKPNVWFNIERLKYENSFMPKWVLRPEYGTLFEYEGYLMQGLQKVFCSVWFSKANGFTTGPVDQLPPTNRGNVIIMW